LLINTSLSHISINVFRNKEKRCEKTATPSTTNLEGFTHFFSSHLQKNGKVREMITTTHNVIVSFGDQRASPV